MEPHADKVFGDVHGNTFACLNPDMSPRIMLAGHVDQIGMIVKHVAKDGKIYVEAIGGIDPVVIPGLTLVIYTADGPLLAVVGQKAIHMKTTEERGKGVTNLESIWLEAGDPKLVVKRVAVGDRVTFQLGMTELLGDYVTSAGLDDKIGVFVVMETLRRLSQQKDKLRCGVYAVSTVQEEIGLRGAKTAADGLRPDAGIAVDVTFASDFPGASAPKMGGVKMGKGPVITVGPNVNPTLEQLLRSTAKSKRIAHQIEASGRATGTDANVIQTSGSGVAAALVSIPNLSMHTPGEIVSLKDVEKTIQLLTETILQISPDTDFIPK
ncbi:MAG: M20/M25/M40 family metallo-hydrolase [Patescibacteria group bacterium]